MGVSGPFLMVSWARGSRTEESEDEEVSGHGAK